MDIAQHFEKIAVGINKHRLISASKQLTVFFVVPVEALGIDTVDMTHTRYVDSSGVALLHCLQHWIDAPMVVVRVINCHPNIYQILSASRLSHTILINP